MLYGMKGWKHMKNKNIENIFNNECLKLINSKNKDYASPNDFYANFKMAEQAGIPMFVGVHVRLLDKISRLNSFLERFNRTGEISANHESIEDTLLDAINYSAIVLDTYRIWKKQNNHEKEVIQAESICLTDNNDIDYTTSRTTFNYKEENICG